MNQPALSVDHLVKNYQIHEKEAGLWGSIKALTKRKYKTVTAVNNISFNIDQGELIGFIGPNGAGKTTTLKTLSGLLYPTMGKVSVLGFDPWERNPAFQKQFALVMGQKNQLWWDLPPMETFLLNKEIYEVPTNQFNQTLEKLTELLEVKDIVNVQVRKLSLGQRMKCELIAALLHNPKVLFLDEPTIGLDVMMQKAVRDFIKQYNREFKATIILTSHYMDDVKALCERVIMIDHGELIFDGKLQQIIDDYATNKIITATFDSEINRQKLMSIGEVKEYDSLQAKLVVPRKDATFCATLLLHNFPVIDLNIEEVPIETVIRSVFNKK